MMQKNRQRKPEASLFRGFFRFLLTLVIVFGALYLGLCKIRLSSRQVRGVKTSITSRQFSVARHCQLRFGCEGNGFFAPHAVRGAS